MDPAKIWVCTRTCDGEYAQQNYENRGFKVRKRRPEVISVPNGKASAAIAFVQSAKERGIHPGALIRVLAFFRDSLPGRCARRTVYGIRLLFGRLQRRLNAEDKTLTSG